MSDDIIQVKSEQRERAEQELREKYGHFPQPYYAMLMRLEAIRKRPRMYIGEVDAELMSALLTGFNQSNWILGYSISNSFHQQIIETRGWEYIALGILRQMRQKNWSEAEIVEELLVIEIETWKRMAETALLQSKEESE